jgi:mannose-1-phosphate guanylyltransferase/mannose-1-phosphate guanylyltransferase/mannose-6-phosphate isomerase
MAARRLTPVILSGGAGTRLWPMSREHFPKQLLPLAGPGGMLQETLERFADPARYGPPLVLTNETLRFSVAEQLRQSGLEGGVVVLEPAARNTAPAVAAAALLALENDPEAMLLVAASDHVIIDRAAFRAAVEIALPAAEQGLLVTFAMAPTRPETGFGYIRLGDELSGLNGVHSVAAFVEKPDAERARRFVEGRDYRWNSGIFLFSAQVLLAELDRHAPAVLSAAQAAVARRQGDLDFIRLEPSAFAGAPSVSLDHAVMERTDKAVTVPCDIGWTDVGSWNELWRIAPKDEGGNVVIGDGVVEESRNCYLRSDGRLVAALGVDDLVVVATDDAVLVMPRTRSQDIRVLIDRLRRDRRIELVDHRRVLRPWGSYQQLHSGERFQVKQLSVKPGGKLSLQKHYHRAEHWVVVAGTALVTRDDHSQLLRENESIYIPAGSLHRLENPGKLPLALIEVQSGGYLGEDDIVRVEDTYGRVEAQARPE